MVMGFHQVRNRPDLRQNDWLNKAAIPNAISHRFLQLTVRAIPV